MTTPDWRSAPARAPSLIQFGQRLLAVIALVSVAILAVWLWIAWEQTRAVQIARMTTTVKLLAAHADHYFAAVGNRLEDLAKDLQELDIQRHPQQAVPLLAAVKAGNPDVLVISVVRPDGQMLVSTAPTHGQSLPNLRTDPEWRAEFNAALKSDGLSIGRPHLSLLHRQWVIPLRYAVRAPGGRVRYLVQAGIPLTRQQQLWRSLDLTADAALGLWREDGYLISRIPADPDGKLYRQQTAGGTLNDAIRAQPISGSYEGTVIVDGTYRIGVYQQLGTQPLYAFLSHLRSTFVALWWAQVRLPLALVAAFLVTIFLVYWQLAVRYSGRMRAIERQLTQPGAGASTPLPSSGVHEIDTMVAALAQSREKLRLAAHNREKLLLSAAAAGTYVVRERDAVVVAADDALLNMLARSESDVVGRSWNELMIVENSAAHDPDAQSLTRRIVRVLTDESPRWLSVTEYRDTLADGESVRYGLAIDVTDREHLLSQVNIQSQRLQALWQLAMSRGRTDREKMQLMLRLALDVLQMDVVMVNEYIGGHLTLRALADDLRRFTVGQVFLLEESLCRQAVIEQSSVIISDLRADPDHYRHPVAVTVGVRGFASVPVFSGSTLYGTMAFMRRATLGEDFGADERAFIELLAAWFGQILLEQQQHAELENIAMTDALTKLTNRRAAEARFIEEMARAKRAGDIFSIAVCDLDRFKLVNDHYGHDTGDQVLLHVADIMKTELREGDWVARWGGEEFIIFLHQSDAVAAHIAMERLRLAIKGNPVSSAHGPLDITTSIGIGTFRGEGDLATVLSEADGCLYEAKRGGRDQVVMSASSRRGTLWKAGMLQHALLENRLVPAYQVMVDLRTQEVVADEALARLIEPDGRIVVAGEFIEAAEGINLIHIVDEVIARQSIQRCAVNARDGKERPGFAHFVNLSPQFLARRDLVEAMLRQVAAQCVDCGTATGPVKSVVLEITERQLIGNFEDLVSDLKPLLDFGFRLALDDFGSGYSSFLYLASLPVSFLKIEGWMVQNMRKNPKVLGMVKSIIALARDQGITTIAECVEDAATADQLRELGADWGQGWYFGRPECELDAAQPFKAARVGNR
jgi:diguanylate cyclase (GGDEF)-like protein